MNSVSLLFVSHIKHIRMSFQCSSHTGLIHLKQLLFVFLTFFLLHMWHFIFFLGGSSVDDRMVIPLLSIIGSISKFQNYANPLLSGPTFHLRFNQIILNKFQKNASTSIASSYTAQNIDVYSHYVKHTVKVSHWPTTRVSLYCIWVTHFFCTINSSCSQIVELKWLQVILYPDLRCPSRASQTKSFREKN